MKLWESTAFCKGYQTIFDHSVVLDQCSCSFKTSYVILDTTPSNQLCGVSSKATWTDILSATVPQEYHVNKNTSEYSKQICKSSQQYPQYIQTSCEAQSSASWWRPSRVKHRLLPSSISLHRALQLFDNISAQITESVAEHLTRDNIKQVYDFFSKIKPSIQFFSPEAQHCHKVHSFSAFIQRH